MTGPLLRYRYERQRGNGEFQDHRSTAPVGGHRGRTARPTVVIYIESIYDVQKKHPAAQVFPTFLPYAQKMLAHISFS